MSILNLHAEFSSSGFIVDIIKEAISLAWQHDCSVTFKVNGVELKVYKDSSIDAVWDEYEERLRGK